MMRFASAAGDYEVIFVDSTLGMPGAGELLQRLRADSRLAKVPLALVSQADEFPAVERTARKIPLCVGVMRTHNGAATEYELNRLFKVTGRSSVTRDERQRPSRAGAGMDRGAGGKAARL